MYIYFFKEKLNYKIARKFFVFILDNHANKRGAFYSLH